MNLTGCFANAVATFWSFLKNKIKDKKYENTNTGAKLLQCPHQGAKNSTKTAASPTNFFIKGIWCQLQDITATD